VSPVRWSDEIDDVIAGDLTAGLAYVTPAGGAVVTAVAPIGLRDREAGTLTFTTSLGFAKKLERIRRDPHVALVYHAREHGFSSSSRYVLVQGTATPRPHDVDWLERVVGPRSERFLGPRRSGRFWDRWLREYYRQRIGVDVDVERVVSWPDLECRGEPEVLGAPLPDAPPPSQPAPKKGTGPRVDVGRAAKRLARLPHRLAAWRDADGQVMVVPYEIGEPRSEGLAVRGLGVPLPPGARRAGIMAHSYRPQLIGLETRQHTGWLADGLYAPHTDGGFKAPANKTLLLFFNGLLAKRNVKKAG
jgi:hypothetical protein